MSVRAKFRCYKISKAGVDSTQVALFAVTDGSPENLEFWRATPSGSITLTVDNPAASIQFQEGKEYYVDFVEVPL